MRVTKSTIMIAMLITTLLMMLELRDMRMSLSRSKIYRRLKKEILYGEKVGQPK